MYTVRLFQFTLIDSLLGSWRFGKCITKHTKKTKQKKTRFPRVCVCVCVCVCARVCVITLDIVVSQSLRFTIGTQEQLIHVCHVGKCSLS